MCTWSGPVRKNLPAIRSVFLELALEISRQDPLFRVVVVMPSTENSSSHLTLPGTDMTADAPAGTKAEDVSTASIYVMRATLHSLAASPCCAARRRHVWTSIANKARNPTYFSGRARGVNLINAALDLTADVKHNESQNQHFTDDSLNHRRSRDGTGRDLRRPAVLDGKDGRLIPVLGHSLEFHVITAPTTPHLAHTHSNSHPTRS
ncbi:hypothetical protein B0H14DRAFT_2628763 [Mycena olivaceomarginata]|nr:hypothetical protein B0H14DRAFT_2628763 [Mycena olivaceomarginata]